MTFREQLRQDVLDVFLNLEEFGETFCIDGKEYVCIADDSWAGLDGSSRDGLNNAGLLALDGHLRTLYIADSIIPRPVPGQELNINGEIWRIALDAGAVSIEQGLLTLKIIRTFS